MNPFKIKTLDDFTIADCEAYLNRYPYGEHSIEVKNRMKGLTKGIIKVAQKEPKSHKPVNETFTDNISTDNVKSSPKKKNNHRKVNGSHNSERTSNVSYQSPQNAVCKEGKSIIDTILWWVGAIVIVIIVGTIIYYLLDLFLPKDVFLYIQKHRWVIYGACLLISKYFNKD